MFIEDIKVMRGPNYWSVAYPKIIVLKFNLKEYEGREVKDLPGFQDRLSALFNTLESARFYEAFPNTFPECLASIALTLQQTAGMKVSYSYVKPAISKGVYHVVFEYKEEEAGLYAAKAALKIFLALSSGAPYDPKEDLEELSHIRRSKYLGLSTGSVVEEAEKRGIPYVKSHDDNLIILGYGSRQKRIQATIASTTSYIGVDMAGNKDGTKNILKEAHIPIPEGVTIESQDELIQAINTVGYPLVTKPLDGNHGRGITLAINSFEQAIEGFKIAKEVSDTIIVERYVSGHDYRLLVINYKFVAAVKRAPASVTGDGICTIGQLIDRINSEPRRQNKEGNILQKIEIDEVTLNILKKHHYTLDSVLPLNEELFIKETGNVSAGAIPADVTDELHPYNVILAERIAKLLDLDICGIDVMSPDLSVPLNENGGAIIEVNAAPGIRMHIEPAEGKSRNAAGAIVEMLFPNAAPATIPIVAVTGTNGKTTATRLIAHIAHSSGLNTGFVTTEGIYLNNMPLKHGDCSGPHSAKLILKDGMVDFAVLECARGGILRSGLGFQFCDVGILTNVSEDHLGLGDIHTLEDMVRVKSVVLKSVKKNGYAILNAEESYLAELIQALECNIALFGITENNLIKEHKSRGGLAAYVSEDNFILFDSKKEISLGPVKEVPITHGGKAHFMVENVLPAIIAAYSQGFDIELIHKSIRSFHNTTEANPGRMNFFEFKDFRIMLDYAHNTQGMHAISKFIQLQEADWNIGIIAAPGDRRDEDIINLGRAAARIFDHIIIRNDLDLRGRTAENIQSLIRQGIQEIDPHKKVDIKPLEAEAIQLAIDNAKKNCLISVFSEKPAQAIQTINQFLMADQSENHKQSVS